jgi:hypothetical protein
MLCLKSQDARVLGNAVGALANLARDEAAIPQLVDEGAARPLVHLCQRSIDGQVGRLVHYTAHYTAYYTAHTHSLTPCLAISALES